MSTCVASEQFDVVGDELTLIPRETVRVRRTAVQSIPHNAFTLVSFEVERWDNDAMWSLSAATRITFNTAGLYACLFHGKLAAAADYNVCWSEFLLNNDVSFGRIIGPQVKTTGGVNASPHLMNRILHRFDAGEFLEVRVVQLNGASAARNLLVEDPRSPELTIARVDYGL